MSSFVRPKGSSSSHIWLITREPLSKDRDKGFLFSSSLGSVFESMLRDAGLGAVDIFYLAKYPDLDQKGVTVDIKAALNANKPPLIIALEEIGAELCSELEAKGASDVEKQLNKNLGSFLVSKHLNFPHYIMPLRSLSYYTSHWDERNISTYFDLQKLREEFFFWKKNGFLKPLPERVLVYENLSLDSILGHFRELSKYGMLSVDIETIYPRNGSQFIGKHPGYPVTIGIASSSNWGMSFSLFRDSTIETVILWRALDELLGGKVILGQNFFQFDWFFFQALGYKLSKDKIIDTRLRHHLLWTELPHSLQFMCRQYTREPYYKDEGSGWSLKNMERLRRYNCLDVCVTYEVWEQQEEEFDERKEIA